MSFWHLIDLFLVGLEFRLHLAAKIVTKPLHPVGEVGWSDMIWSRGQASPVRCTELT
jgi:hypothetical protein